MAMKLYSDSDIKDIADSIRNANNSFTNKGYTRLEYIQSDGLQYLELNMKANQDTKILLDFQQTEVYNSPRWFFGSRITNVLDTYGFVVGSDGNYATPYNKGNGSPTFYINNANVLNNTNRHILIKQRLNDNTDNMGTFDNDTIYSISTGTFYETFETPKNLILFNADSGGTLQTGCKIKLYVCKIWKDGINLTMNLIPVKRNSDNEIGLYDTVNKVFYENQGSGTFVGGDIIGKYKVREMADAIDNVADEIGDIEDNISTALTTLNTDLSGDSVYKMIAVGKGDNVTLNDTEEESLDDFKILGKTVQNGTPSPSSPVVIENVLGKNIFDESQFLQASGWSKNNSGYYTGTVQNLYAKFKSGGTDFAFPVLFKVNTQYTLSFKAYVSASNVLARFLITYTDETISNICFVQDTTETSYSAIINPEKNIKKINFNYGNSGTLYIKDVQIEEGTTATPYLSFNTVQIKRTDGTSEETYSFPLGDIPLMAGDYIDKLGIHHIKKQTIKSGSSATLSDAKSNSAYICTHKASGNLSNKTITFSSSVTDAIIEYELETPTFTPLTSAQQTVFNEILQDGTYEVVTTYTGYGNLAPDMEINYHKDLQPRLADIVDDVTDILQ